MGVRLAQLFFFAPAFHLCGPGSIPIPGPCMLIVFFRHYLAVLTFINLMFLLLLFIRPQQYKYRKYKQGNNVREKTITETTTLQNIMSKQKKQISEK